MPAQASGLSICALHTEEEGIQVRHPFHRTLKPHSNNHHTDAAVPRRLLLLYLLLHPPIFPSYLLARLRSYALSRQWPDLPPHDWRRKAWRTIIMLENAARAWELLGWGWFLWDGQYPSILMRILRLRLVPSSPRVTRLVSYEFMNRQLVWSAFTVRQATSIARTERSSGKGPIWRNGNLVEQDVDHTGLPTILCPSSTYTPCISPTINPALSRPLPTLTTVQDRLRLSPPSPLPPHLSRRQRYRHTRQSPRRPYWAPRRASLAHMPHLSPQKQGQSRAHRLYRRRVRDRLAANSRFSSDCRSDIWGGWQLGGRGCRRRRRRRRRRRWYR